MAEIEPHLARRPANFQPLTPVEFLVRAIEAYPTRPAVQWNDRRWDYRGFGEIVGRFAAWLRSSGIKSGEVVSVMSANRPEMLAAHYAVPMLGAILNSINTRLDAESVAYILEHSGSRLLIADPNSAAAARAAAAKAGVPIFVLPGAAVASEDAVLDLLSEELTPEKLDTTAIVDEWQPICINYTSGTTGRPKGAVYHHRGAYLNALGNVIALGLTDRSVYLWTLPMFHCNGWCHTWAVTAAAGLHVCLEKPDPALVFPAIEKHGVTHFSCAPVVLYMLLDHPARDKRIQGSARVKVATGGAAPTTTLIAQLDALGFDLTHLYGLTESYGPATLCEIEDGADMSATDKAAFLARQGIRHTTASRVRVVDDEGRDVPCDGTTLGEIVLRGNTLMAGYYHDAAATDVAFRDNVFHTGDVAVLHPDNFVEIKDRSKDIIISGGENISSLEVENVLHQHPAILLAAVVAGPDPKWGEVPVAFLELKAGVRVEPDELRAFCKARMAGFKVPRLFVVRELPKTATGKVQKFALREEAKRALG